MTAIATRPATRPATSLSIRAAMLRPFAALAAAWRWLDRERRLRATIHTLHGLPDRTLKDIGLERGHIDAVIRERAHCRGQ